MTTSKSSLEYMTCTEEELRGFIRARNVPVPWEEPLEQLLKANMIIALEEADQEPITFRFLDLSAEMRNHVYDELLSFSPYNRTKCYPAILTTCHQIHDEANSLLYADKDTDVTLSLIQQPRGEYDFPACPRITVNGCPVSIDPGWSFLKYSLEWPSLLSKVERLQLQINVSRNDVLSAGAGAGVNVILPSKGLLLNHVLYDLQHLLNGTGNLTGLDVKIDCDRPMTHETCSDMFSPIRLFHAPKHFTFTNIPASVAARIQLPEPPVQNSCQPAKWIHRYRDLNNEAASLRNLKPVHREQQVRVRSRLEIVTGLATARNFMTPEKGIQLARALLGA